MLIFYVTSEKSSVLDSISRYRSVNVKRIYKYHTDCCAQSPSGGRYNSSSYGDGQYHWLVPNPVEEGSYTCLIPSRYVHVLCLPPGTSQGPEATLAVDDLKVRVMLMEAQQRSLQQDVTILQQENVQLKEDNQLLAQNVTVLQQKNVQLQGDNQQLKADNQLLAQNVTILQQENVHIKRDNQRFAQNISALQQHVMQLESDSQQVTAFIQGKWKKSSTAALCCFASNPYYSMHLFVLLNLCLSHC